MVFMMQLVMAIHVGLYRLTSGRFGGRMNGGDVLLLTTVGRKSGATRTTPVMYLRDGERYLIAASAGGSDKHPGWYWNAAKGDQPVQIQIQDQVMTVAVEDAQGEQRDTFYQRFKDAMQSFAGYEKQTQRRIPVLILTPRS